jgi:hypothetical protein
MDAQITTLIPSYRRPQLLVQAIRSVLNQTYRNFELHVFDNASGDDTARVVQEFANEDQRVKYHCHLANIGLMQNFRAGIESVSTPYFNLLSDDDYLLPDFFETAIQGISAGNDFGFFFGGLLFFDGRQVVAAPVERWGIEGAVAPEQMFKALFHPGGWITWTSSMFRTAAVTGAGGLRPELGYGGDVELLGRLSIRNAAFVSRKPCAVINVHHASAAALDRHREYSADKLLDVIESLELEIGKVESAWLTPLRNTRAMRQVLRSGLEWRFLRQALVSLAQCRRESALETAETLKTRCGRAGLAAVVRLAASPGPSGLAARLGLRSLRRARWHCRRRVQQWRSQKYTNAVEYAAGLITPDTPTQYS